MSNVQTYSGGCQCGKVKYSVKLDLTKPVLACNCSMCGRAGTLLTFTPATEFELLSGHDALTDYQFNKMNVHHLFCSSCGIKSFGRGTGKDGVPTVAINARCLEGVEVSSLEVREVDGRKF